MKKSLLGLLLAVAMVVPAFAEKGEMSINGKLGLGLISSVSLNSDKDAYSVFKTDMPFMLGAEFFYGVIDCLSVGVGANYLFDTETKAKLGGDKPKGGTTNIYLAVKPEIKTNSDIFSSVYFIGQIGLSMGRCKVNGQEPSMDSGLYLGTGFGTIIKDVVLVELIFSTSNSTIKEPHEDFNLEYSVTSLNIGYKFTI